MTISINKLIDGLEMGCRKAANQTEDLASQEMFVCMKIILDELRLRNDEDRLERLFCDGIEAVSETMLSLHDTELERRFSVLRESLPDRISWQYYQDNIEELLSIAERACLETKTSLAGQPGLFNFIKPIVDWEIRVNEYIGSSALPETGVRTTITAEGVIDFIRKQGSDYQDAEVRLFRRLPGGFSKETIIFQIETAAHGTEDLVLRGEGAVKLLNISGQNLEKEFWLLKYIHRTGLKVAEPLWLNNSLAPRYFISRRMPGELKGTHIGKSMPMPDKLVETLAVELARIHSTPLDFSRPELASSHIGAIFPFTRKEAVKAALREWTDYWRDSIGRKSPLIITAIDWVYDNIPSSDEPPVLVHGDCGLNNLLIDNDEVSAVLDWEISHLGDPNEDISWALFGMSTPDNRKRFVDKYMETSGNRIDEFSLKYYEVVAALKILHSLYEAQEKYQKEDIPEIKLCKLGLPHIGDSLRKLLTDIDEADRLKNNR